MADLFEKGVRVVSNVKENSRRYFTEINIARGIAVLLVLLGHSFPRLSMGDPESYAIQVLYRAIYSFHMPLFIFISGFTASRKLYDSRTSVSIELIKNAKRLLVPYFFYSLVTFVLKQIFSIYAASSFDIGELWTIILGRSPNGGLWFLWTLFITSLIFIVISRLKASSSVFLATGFILTVLYYVLPASFIEQVLRLSVYYAVGVVIARYYDTSILKNYEAFKRVFRANVILPLIVFSFIVGNAFYTVSTGTNAIAPITALLGSFAVLDISKRLADMRSKARRFFDAIGGYGYDIYLLGYFVQIPIRVVGYSILHLPYLLVVVSMFVCGLAVPYVASRFVIRKVDFLRKVLLGTWSSSPAKIKSL